MSLSINITAYSGKNNPEFLKHFSAVKFCIENNLSYPKETSEFFKGKINEDDLEDYNPKYILDIIENGVQVPLKYTEKNDVIRLKIADIDSSIEEIIIELS